MDMHVDQAGHKGLSAQIHDGLSDRFKTSGRGDLFDPAVAYKDVGFGKVDPFGHGGQQMTVLQEHGDYL